VVATGASQPTTPRVGLWGPAAALRGLLDRPLASYYLLLASSALLLAIGLVMVFSATSVDALRDEGNAWAEASRQACWALVGLVAFWITQRLPVRTYRFLAFPLLVVSLALLSLLAVFPSVQIGPVQTEELWLQLGPLQVQPSEIAKVALTLWGADVLVRKGRNIGTFRELAVPLFPVVGLLFATMYNDLGTLLCLLLIFLALLFVAGVRIRIFVAMFGVALVGVLLLIVNRSYRLQRFTSFLDPEADAWGSGYQAVQGLYAVADGGWFGVGLGEGRQKWDWLPHANNDFIFAIIAEELGVVGSVVVLTLFAVLAYAGLRIARRVDDPFRRLVAAAVTVWLVGQAVINIGGVVGLVPITGLPLPFISDGGSALVVVLAAVGMLASFARAEPDAARALHARPAGRLVRLLWAPLPPLPKEPPKEQPTRPRPAATTRRRVPPSRGDRRRPGLGAGRRGDRV